MERTGRTVLPSREPWRALSSSRRLPCLPAPPAGCHMFRQGCIPKHSGSCSPLPPRFRPGRPAVTFVTSWRPCLLWRRSPLPYSSSGLGRTHFRSAILVVRLEFPGGSRTTQRQREAPGADWGALGNTGSPEGFRLAVSAPWISHGRSGRRPRCP